MFKVGNYELEIYGSPAARGGKLTATIVTEEPLATLARKLNSGEIVWGNAAGQESRINLGIEAMSLDAVKGRATITWQVSNISADVEEQLRESIDVSDAAMVELADMIVAQEEAIAAQGESLSAAENRITESAGKITALEGKTAGYDDRFAGLEARIKALEDREQPVEGGTDNG